MQLSGREVREQCHLTIGSQGIVDGIFPVKST